VTICFRAPWNLTLYSYLKVNVYLFYIMAWTHAHLNRDQVRSLEFAVNSCFREIFCVRSQTVIEESKKLFNCPPISETMTTRICKFLHKSIFTLIMNCVKAKFHRTS